MKLFFVYNNINVKSQKDKYFFLKLHNFIFLRFNMAKEEAIEVEGVVKEALSNTTLRV